MEGRLTVCNMSIEAGARAGMIAPDDTTFSYLAGRPFAPQGQEWEQQLARWRALPSDPDAGFDREATERGRDRAHGDLGHQPRGRPPITGRVPDPAAVGQPQRREAMQRALPTWD